MNKVAVTALSVALFVFSATAFAGGQHIDGKNYKVDVSAAACSAESECVATVKIETPDSHHLNKEYPYKVKVADADGIKYAKAEFGRNSGDFVEASAHSGVITVKFTPEKAGKVDVTGTLKLAVCSDKDCATATEAIKLSVDVAKKSNKKK